MKNNKGSQISNAPSLLLPEFSRQIDIKKISNLPISITFTATEKEKEALAKRLDLVSMKSFTVQGKIEGKLGDSPLKVSVRLKAEVMQSCVVSLKELPDQIDEMVKLSLFPFNVSPDMLNDTFDDDEPEALVLNKDGTIEVGEVFVQYLSLALDPYPKFE
ncbi:MAG: hypothetical protein ACK5PQ_01975 [Alphaproteobacteria bacterium]